MIGWVNASRKRDERGFALITVLLAMLVMSALTVVMVQNVISSFNQDSHQIQVTNALTAADAGLTDMVYSLQQAANWGSGSGTYEALYCTNGVSGCTTNQWYGWNTVGAGQYEAHVDTCSVMSASRIASTGCNANIGDEVLTIVGKYPANTGATQTIQAVLRNSGGGPAAFNYAMFADKGIQIHHHNDSYISPTIVTPQIHSNGFITLNYPGTYRVGNMEAVGKITVADGGGSIPSGSVTQPYDWPYWISNGDSTNPPRCYPALQYPSNPQNYPTGGSSNAYWNVPTYNGTSYSCSGNPTWSPHAVVVGDLSANSVEITKNGDTQQTTPGSTWTPTAPGTTCGVSGQAGFTDPITGVCIPDQPGDVTAGTVKFDVSGQTFTGLSSSSNPPTYTYTTSGNCGSLSNCNKSTGNTGSLSSCSDCNQGSGDTAGWIGGDVDLENSSYAPPVDTFPGYNYTANTLPTAEVDQGNAKTSTAACSALTSNPYCHVFSSAGNFTSWMENNTNVSPTSGTYQGTNPCTNTAKACMVWVESDGKTLTNQASLTAYVMLWGDYELLAGAGNLSLAENSLRTAYSTPSNQATPTIMVAGALVNETGAINLTASLTVVGPTMDPLNPLTPDANLPQGTSTVPGLLASGANGNAITSTDYDTDSPYTSASNYQQYYRNQVIVRGLVYSATWNSSTSSSTASDQHWHNSDPKNAQIIVGAQMGGTLHDCSNFTFDYDPLIENLPGFTGGTTGSVYVLNWTQL